MTVLKIEVYLLYTKYVIDKCFFYLSKQAASISDFFFNDAWPKTVIIGVIMWLKDKLIF